MIGRIHSWIFKPGEYRKPPSINALQLMLSILHLSSSSSFYVLILLKARKFQESLMTFSLAFSSWDVKLHGVIISLLISWWIDVASQWWLWQCCFCVRVLSVVCPLLCDTRHNTTSNADYGIPQSNKML